MLRVTAAILRRDAKILVARRLRPRWLRGKWEFPGGKIEPGESPQECLARELREELGLETRVGSFLMTNRHRYPTLQVELWSYEVEYLSGELVLSDHDEARWVTEEELGELDFAEADLPIVRRLLGIPDTKPVKPRSPKGRGWRSRKG